MNKMTVACGDLCPKCLIGKIESYQPIKGDYLLRCSRCDELFIELCDECLAHGVAEFQQENR